MLVILPGTPLPARPLLAVLREEHEARRADYQMRAKWRAEQGIPSTPDIDWREEEKRLTAMLEIVRGETPDPALVALGATATLTAMSPAPRDPGEWSPPSDLDGVTITPRAVSAKERNGLRDAWRAAIVTGANSRPAADALIRAVLVRVDGVEVYGQTDRRGVTLDDMSTLWECGLGPWLLSAALHLSSLDAKKALRCGVQQPSTSAPSSATAAPRLVVSPSGATAAVSPTTPTGQSERTHAPADTSGATLT